MLATLRHHLPALGSVAVRGLGVLAGFGTTFLIGRNWGPEANGTYALVTQTAIFLAVVAVGGLDMGVVRFFAAPLARGNRIAVASLWRTLALTLALTTAVIAATLLVRAVFGPDLLGPLPTAALPALIVLLAARALIRALGAVLRAHRHYLLGQAIDGLFIPAMIVTPLALGLLPDVEAALLATAAAGLLSVGIGFAASLGLSLAALFGVGAAVSLLTGKSVLFSGLRQLGIGAAAAAVTYAVGTIIGVGVAG